MHGVLFFTWCVAPHRLPEHACEMLGCSSVADDGLLRGSVL